MTTTKTEPREPIAAEARAAPEAPPPVRKLKKARRFTLRGRGLAIRFAVTALFVLGLILLYDAFVGIGASDPWAFVVVAPLGIILSFLVAGWMTALLFYDPDNE